VPILSFKHRLITETRQMNSTLIKFYLAAMAAGVLVGMGVMTAAVGGSQSSTENQFGGAGETSTESTAPTEIETAVRRARGQGRAVRAIETAGQK
jgi:hypothetical protein